MIEKVPKENRGQQRIVDGGKEEEMLPPFQGFLK